MNRYAQKSAIPTENPDSPVQSPYSSIVIARARARPIRSPTAPNINPPVAHPSTKMLVA